MPGRPKVADAVRLGTTVFLRMALQGFDDRHRRQALVCEERKGRLRRRTAAPPCPPN